MTPPKWIAMAVDDVAREVAGAAGTRTNPYVAGRMTGDDAIDDVLTAIRRSARALAARKTELAPMEYQIVEQVLGSYLDALLDQYLGMPPDWRTERELPTGGTARAALLRSLTLMEALLKRAEQNLYGRSAATLALSAQALQTQYATAAGSGDVEPVEISAERALRWPRWIVRIIGILLGVTIGSVLMVCIFLLLRTYPTMLLVPIGVIVIYLATWRKR